MQTLDIISVNIWQMVVSLANLVLLFLIVKKFLYKPVKRMLETRENAIKEEYDVAEAARNQAMSNKKAYEEKLDSAKAEAEQLIKTAVTIAGEREKEILAQAKDKADGILRQARFDAALEIKKSEESIKKEIVELSSLLTEKVLEREVSPEDHRQFIDSFIESIGDGDDTKK